METQESCDQQTDVTAGGKYEEDDVFVILMVFSYLVGKAHIFNISRILSFCAH